MNRQTLFAGAAALLALGASPALSQEASVENLNITGGFMRAAPKTAPAGAAFLLISSTGPADRLVGFSSPACLVGELHTHIHDNGMMRMRQVEAIDVPAGGSVALEPGGFHLMCIGLVEPLVEGQTIPVTLTFENAGEVQMTLPVKAAGAMD